MAEEYVLFQAVVLKGGRVATKIVDRGGLLHCAMEMNRICDLGEVAYDGEGDPELNHQGQDIM